ncbi:hypothetical protein [Lacihabitans sp. CS3-21]|nr:hypothetical protein [Lacihabitans sp. CS3-21]
MSGVDDKNGTSAPLSVLRDTRLRCLSGVEDKNVTSAPLSDRGDI